MSRGLPLAVWAGALTTGAVAATVGTTYAVLRQLGPVRVPELEALGAGAGAGLLVGLAVVLAAVRLAAGMRALREDAVQRLQDPSAPVAPGVRRLPTSAGTSELVQLGAVLEALHLRVRLGDRVGEQHRRDAETAGAGVYELLSGLVAAEEAARGQLSAELHDTVAQSLAVARGLLHGRPSSPEELDRLSDHVEDAEEQVRAVMARTRPPALRDGDLASAVDDLRCDLAARYGLDVSLSWPDEPYPLPLASAVTVYRFFQEALLNVVKHADVDDARAELAVEQDAVVARVVDAGPGFEPQDVRPVKGRHVGLGLLRERARLSGGSLEVSCGPYGGTTLTLRLPRPVGGPVPAGAGLPLPLPAPRTADDEPVSRVG